MKNEQEDFKQEITERLKQILGTIPNESGMGYVLHKRITERFQSISKGEPLSPKEESFIRRLYYETLKPNDKESDSARKDIKEIARKLFDDASTGMRTYFKNLSLEKRLQDKTKELALFATGGRRTLFSDGNPGINSKIERSNSDIESGETNFPVFLNPLARIVSAKGIFCVGRTEALEKMADLVKKNTFVLVAGVRGGGKTTFVNKFVSDNCKEFSNVLYVSVRTGHVTESVIQAFKEAKVLDPQEMMDHLKISDLLMQLIDSLVKLNFERPLMIIDAANLEPSLTYFINEWQKHQLNWKIIITSSLSEIELKDTAKLILPDLDEISAAKLFDNFVKRDVSADFKQEVITIFRHFKCNPILCELLSKLIQSNRRINTEHLHDLETLFKRRAEQPSTIHPDLASKFESNEEMTIVEYISFMFSDLASTLHDNEKVILRYLSILPARPMDDERLLHLLPITLPDLEIIDDLVKKGWLLRGEQNSVYCHELYQLAIQHLLKPDAYNCELLISKIESLIRLNDLDDLEKDVINLYFELLPIAIEITNNLKYDKQFIDPRDEGLAQKLIEVINPHENHNASRIAFNDSGTYATLLHNISDVYRMMSIRNEAFLFAYNSLLMNLRVHNGLSFQAGRNILQLSFSIGKMHNAELAYQLLNIVERIYNDDPETPEILRINLMIAKGNVCRNLGRMDDAISYFTESIDVCKKNTKYRFYRARAMDNLGFVYSVLGRNILIEQNESDVTGIELCLKSISLREEALKLREEIQTKKESLQIGILYSNIGAVQSLIKRFPDSLESYGQCLRIRENLRMPQNHISMAILKNNMATAYAKMVYYDGEMSHTQRKSNLLKALRLCNEGWNIKIKNDNGDSYIAPSYFTKGLILLLYYRLDTSKKYRLLKAREFAEKSLELRKTYIPPIPFAIKESEKLIREIMEEQS